MKDSQKKFLKTTGAILLLILLLGSFLRLFRLDERSFVADEFLGVNASYGYLQTGEWRRWDFNKGEVLDDKDYYKDPLFDFDLWKGGKDTYTRAWVYNWQVAQAIKFLPDDNEASYRLISVFWGIISILIVYWVGWKFTGKKKIGLIAAFLMAVSIVGIEFSRKVRMYSMFMPVFLLFSYFSFKAIESTKKYKTKALNLFNKKTGLNLVYLSGAFLLGILSMHLHQLAANVIVIILAYCLVMASMTYGKNKKILNRYSAYFLTLIGIGLISKIILGDQVAIWGTYLIFENHYSYISKILFDYGSAILAVALITSGSIYYWRKKKRGGIFILVSFWSILLMAIFFWKRNIGAQYVYFIMPFQVMLLAGGIYGIAKYLKDNLKKSGEKVFLAIMIGFLLILPNWGHLFSVDGPYIQKASSSDPNYKKVFGYFMKKKGADDVLITRNFRNYYFRDANADVYSLGGERSSKEEKKITLEKLQSIINENSCGWMIYSDNDESFISKEARLYIKKNLEQVSNSSVRGPVTVIRWCDKDS